LIAEDAKLYNENNKKQQKMGLHLSGHAKEDEKKDANDFLTSNKPLTGKALVQDKLTRLYGKQLSQEDLEKFSDILSDVEKIKKVYLHTDFSQAQQLVCTIYLKCCIGVQLCAYLCVLAKIYCCNEIETG
jgi:hypothetical protein